MGLPVRVEPWSGWTPNERRKRDPHAAAVPRCGQGRGAEGASPIRQTTITAVENVNMQCWGLGAAVQGAVYVVWEEYKKEKRERA